MKVADHGRPTTVVPAGSRARNSRRDISRVNSSRPARQRGDQWRNSVAVCDSIGNHLFGVVMTQARPTRRCSATNRRWSASSPTCSMTALATSTSAAPSAKGMDLASASTNGHDGVA